MKPTAIAPEVFQNDQRFAGAKGLVFVGQQLLIYRRDTHTDRYPLKLDLAGGGPEPSESPWETFQREVKEEFNLDITRAQIEYTKPYPAQSSPDLLAYFFVVKLDATAASRIHLGNEGVEYVLTTPEAYLEEPDVAWPYYQKLTRDYLAWAKTASPEHA